MQRKLLIIFSENEGVKEAYTKEFLIMVGASLGGIQKALKYLLQMDYVYQSALGEYKILDPLIKEVLLIQKINGSR